MLADKNRRYNGPKSHREIVRKVNKELMGDKYDIHFLFSIIGLFLGVSGIGFHFKYAKDFDFLPIGSFKVSEKFKEEKRLFEIRFKKSKSKRQWSYLERNPDKKQIWEKCMTRRYEWKLNRKGYRISTD